jgi:hypothetical protein
VAVRDFRPWAGTASSATLASFVIVHSEERRMRPVVQPGSDGPAIEVVAFRDGREIARELYDTPDEAARAVDRWSESNGVVCQVDDLSARHRPSDVRDPAPDDARYDADEERVDDD